MMFSIIISRCADFVKRLRRNDAALTGGGVIEKFHQLRADLAGFGMQEEILQAVHAVCGSKSGRDIDKAAATGLTPCFEHGTVTFEQARLTLICRKIYVSDVKPECFIDRSLLGCYSDNDYHRAYVGEIIKVLVK